MSLILTVRKTDGTLEVEEFDDDEIGTLDDIWTGFMITELKDIKSIVIEVK